MIYIAHRNDLGEIQTVQAHSMNTAALAAQFAIPELKQTAELIALLHDVGKYQADFQARINGATVKIEHSNCGAKLIAQLMGANAAALLAELCIIGHHTGIPDCGTPADACEAPTLFARLKRNTQDYSAYRGELEIPPAKELAIRLNAYIGSGCRTKEALTDKFAFLVRFCFSCLVDADSIDTANAVNGAVARSLTADFSRCAACVDRRFHAFESKTDLQAARARIQAQAFENLKKDAEVYFMNMPTGSGKTLASMRCALELAMREKKRRIIYVIPFNSIIDQTAETFESLFGDCAQILRHQSTFNYEDQENLSEDERQTARLATENWDAQIIITTMVQFFESVYSNKRGKLRKLHNMADSILVFDEAHLMPKEFLQPCLQAVAHITRYLHAKALFLTATMPDFQNLFEAYTLEDLKTETLITDTADFRFFAHKKYVNLGTVGDADLIARAADCAAALIVVNSKKAAAVLYRSSSGRKYHLSTYMTPIHRARVIRAIKEELIRLNADFPSLLHVPSERRITVVSTSLIEAGIDLDFSAVFRELAGLDHILQAGGRCNREGLRESGTVFVFRREETRRKQTAEQNIALGIMEEYHPITSPEAVAAYYKRLFAAEEATITQHTLSRMCAGLQQIPFATYNREMKLVDETAAVSVAVAQDAAGKQLVRQMQETGLSNNRKLQRYFASVKPYELDELIRQHAADDYGTGVFCLTNPDYYDDEIGIVFEGKDIIIA